MIKFLKRTIITFLILCLLLLGIGIKFLLNVQEISLDNSNISYYRYVSKGAMEISKFGGEVLVLFATPKTESKKDVLYQTYLAHMCFTGLKCIIVSPTIELDEDDYERISSQMKEEGWNIKSQPIIWQKEMTLESIAEVAKIYQVVQP